MNDTSTSVEPAEEKAIAHSGRNRLTINILLCVICCLVLFGVELCAQFSLSEYMGGEEAFGRILPFYLATVVLLAIWIVGIGVSYSRDRRIASRNAMLESKNTQLAHDIDIVGKATKSILETYRQVTYIDLEENLMEVVYAPFMPQFQNSSYTEVLELYATHGMIADDDVATFAERMSIANIREELADSDFMDVKFHSRKSNGSTEVCIATVSVIDREDGVPRSVAFTIRSAEDVLKEDRAQRDMLIAAAEQAETASKAKGEFLSRVSHDMRTPLNAIQGMTSIALMNLDDKERVQDSLSKIDSSSAHLLEIINEVLDMGKVESGKMVLDEEPFDLRDLVESVRGLLAPQAEAKEIELRFNCDVEDPYVVGDPKRLRELLVNIAGNSVKFTNPHGTVALGVQELEHESLGKRAFTFTIADNGIGMDKAFLERLFEPFSRAEDARVRRLEGSGLGMSIALNFARLMGGDISVESELNKGSCFKVNVFLGVLKEIEHPGDEESGSASEASVSDARKDAGKDAGVGASADASMTASGATSADASMTAGRAASADASVSKVEDFVQGDFAGRRALVVDDVEINAEVACELLRAVGIESEVAINGQEAIDVIKNSEPEHFDIVFMDIQMPVMDGLDSARGIRALAQNGRPDLDDLPIVAMTANAFADDVSNSRSAGMDGHIAKPISLKELKSTLERWLGSPDA